MSEIQEEDVSKDGITAYVVDSAKTEIASSFRLYGAILLGLATLSPKRIFKAASAFRKKTEDLHARHEEAVAKPPSVKQGKSVKQDSLRFRGG